MNEEFHVLSSEVDASVNQTSQIQPMCKEARTIVVTVYMDPEDSEKEIGMQRTDRHVVIIDSGCEMNKLMWLLLVMEVVVVVM